MEGFYQKPSRGPGTFVLVLSGCCLCSAPNPTLVRRSRDQNIPDFNLLVFSHGTSLALHEDVVWAGVCLTFKANFLANQVRIVKHL